LRIFIIVIYEILALLCVEPEYKGLFVYCFRDGYIIKYKDLGRPKPQQDE